MKLYVVPTPIGNLKDITERAKDVLASADFILCEDTRSTLKLLNAFGIKNKLIACHKFNETEISSKIFNNGNLKNENLKAALVSDAGTPCISDPGNLIVKTAIKNNIDVIPLAGASAAVMAFSASGFSGRFCFLGFLDRKKIKQEFSVIIENIQNGQGIYENYIFYESPKRILETLRVLKQFTFKDNFKLAVFNDLTKLYEKSYYGNLDEVIEALEQNDNRELGEYTVILNITNIESGNKENSEVCMEALIVNEMATKNITKKEAIKCLSEKYSHKILFNAGEKLKELLS